MGNNASNDTSKDEPTNSSTGHEKTFGETFAEEHNKQGAGATFEWKGSEYSTDRADGRDIKAEKGNESVQSKADTESAVKSVESVQSKADTESAVKSGESVQSKADTEPAVKSVESAQTTNTSQSDSPKGYAGSFGQAFSQAHKELGSGNTFTWKEKEYTTDRNDGRDLKAEGEKKKGVQPKEEAEPTPTTKPATQPKEETEPATKSSESKQTTNTSQSDSRKEYAGNFEQAFAQAHKELGSGHTFIWNKKEYTTDRDDKRDLKAEKEKTESVKSKQAAANTLQSNAPKEYKGTFKEAFQQAHKELGPGHTFLWNGKEYTTNKDDARNAQADHAATSLLKDVLNAPKNKIFGEAKRGKGSDGYAITKKTTGNQDLQDSDIPDKYPLTRVPHWPSEKSGITIGRGIDLGQHDKLKYDKLMK
ncbi:hypothetical protein RFI_11910, partial [Reticulomyxa filosa]